jgi:hypothetical protein
VLHPSLFALPAHSLPSTVCCLPNRRLGPWTNAEKEEIEYYDTKIWTI